MQRAFDQEMADRICDFTRDLGAIVRECRAYEAEMLAEIDALKSDLARMTAKLQGVRDQVADLPDTIPNVGEIAARGSAHQAVNEDIRESMQRMEGVIENAQPVNRSRGLSMLLDSLRENQRRVEA